LKKPSNKKAPPIKAAEKRPVDIQIDDYVKSHQNPTNKLLNYIATPLTVFSLLGLFWAIPFPHFKFLGQYNGFFNWASFLMAFCIYYYYKLSPILSYFMLFVFFGFSYGVMELDQLQKTGGPSMGSLCFVIFISTRIVQFIGYRLERITPPLSKDLQFLLIAPIWLFHFALKRFSIKY
jgi:uncharacterized membrane protein YGL010W